MLTAGAFAVAGGVVSALLVDPAGDIKRFSALAAARKYPDVVLSN
jgi:hypothetical protein